MSKGLKSGKRGRRERRKIWGRRRRRRDPMI
jgi:hypothetical protein